MSDKFFVGLDLTGVEDNGIQRPISRVTLLVDDENSITAGNDTGMELLADCPHATQAMVNAILAQVNGYQYRMFSADDAALDPSAELGDGVTAGGLYSVISRIEDDGSGYSGITAPGEAELEDEFPTGGFLTNEFNRKIAQTRSQIIKTAEQIALLVSNEVEGLEGKIELTASSLTTEINNVNSGLNSKIEQTASSLTTEINNTEAGLNSKIEQTASSLTSQINGQGNQISSISQSVNQIRLTVQGQGSAISSLEQSVNGFRLEVNNGSDSSWLYLMSGQTQLSSAEIILRGAVTFEDLSGAGQSVINGANLSTGNINAGNLDLTGTFTLTQGGSVRGFLGCGEGYDGSSTTYGPILGSGLSYLIATNAGVRMQDIYGGAIWVTGGNCFSSSDMQTYSDRRLKGDIDYDLECYKTFFRALKPCRFLMLSNPGRGYHTGFVAQDVQAAMEAANLSQMDFAGLADAKMPDGTPGLTLSYGSFAALNTYMTQCLDRITQDLERRVAALERRTENE